MRIPTLKRCLARPLLLVTLIGAAPALVLADSPRPGAADPAARAEWRAEREALREAYRAERLARLDLDGDGVISPAEIDAAAARRSAEIDADGDAVITAEELLAWREARMAEGRQQRVERMLARMDADGDGVVRAEEFAAATAARMQRGEGRPGAHPRKHTHRRGG
jgi:hypothetical protein